MGAWAYCTNEDCQRGFDKPSFAEIIAKKRECPACGTINNVGDDLGTALDEAFAEVAELITTESNLAKAETRLHGSRPDTVIIDDELPGVWQASDFFGGATDCDVAVGTTVPQEMRKTASQASQYVPKPFIWRNKDSIFHCSCGCTVFRQLNQNCLSEYTCNACGTTYKGE